MNEITQVVGAILIAFAPFLFPGIAYLSTSHQKHLLAWGARLLVSNLIIWILLSLVMTTIHIPLIVVAPVILITTCIVGIIRWRKIATLEHGWFILAIVTPFVMLCALFAVPLLRVHEGLPTGDAQKAVLWAQDIIDHQRLPDYSQAQTLLNRDPVDFYTPGLHTLVASVMSVSPFPLHSVALFSIGVAIAVVFVGAAISKDLFDTHGKFFPASIVALYILTNIRFLRYVREPGYHLQNSLGEVLLFALLMFALSLIHRWRTKEAILAAATMITLLVTHQFSSFIGAFMLLPALLVFAMTRRHIYLKKLASRPTLLVANVIALLFLVGGGYVLGLDEKIPHLFTTAPHLTAELPTLTEYPYLLGKLLVSLGIGGVLLLLAHITRRHQHYHEAAAFVGATIVLLILSQGPRIFIDIPPVRALFYSVVPLAICAGFAVAKIVEALTPLDKKIAAPLILLIATMVGVGSIYNVQTSFASLSHTVRTNSTLTSEQMALINSLSKSDNAILIDDYNRRSAAWFTLTKRPVFSRLASEGTRQLAETNQSTLRHQLYLKQLDFEKIYSLGNWPGISELTKRYNIGHIVTQSQTSVSNFAHNPRFASTLWGGDMIVFESSLSSPELGISLQAANNNVSSDISSWLLRPTTLANDIGDNEDTFNHLPAALVASRLSEAQFDGQQTYRTTRDLKPVIAFNVNDYVWPLWDKDNNNTSDTAVDLFIRLAYAPSKPISVITPSGRLVSLTSQSTILHLETNEIVRTPEGTVSFIIDNPLGEPLAIDMVALGLARVP